MIGCDYDDLGANEHSTLLSLEMRPLFICRLRCKTGLL